MEVKDRGMAANPEIYTEAVSLFGYMREK